MWLEISEFRNGDLFFDFRASKQSPSIVPFRLLSPPAPLDCVIQESTIQWSRSGAIFDLLVAVHIDLVCSKTRLRNIIRAPV